MSTLKVEYKCRCMAAPVFVDVPSRLPGEDVAFWMAHCLQASMFLDHRRRSPTCTSEKMEYAKIPHDDGQPIGAVAPRH